MANTNKKGNKTYKCTYYKKDNKCSSSIKLNINKDIINYISYHNHNISKKKEPQSKAKSEISNNINKYNNLFDIKPKNLYKDTTKNLGIIIPEYKSVRSLINRTINKNFPKDIKEWDENPNEHESYKTISGEDFLVKKEANFILFQSQSQLFIQHLH